MQLEQILCITEARIHEYHVTQETGHFKSFYTICGSLVDRALDSSSKGLRFDCHCWSCVAVLGKLLIPYCLCLPSCDGYLVDKNCD